MTEQPDLHRYTTRSQYPALVQRAVSLARSVGAEHASLPETGRLLMLLAAQRPGARIGETGTAAGIGAAWVASGMTDDATLYTVEHDERLAAAAAVLFGHMPNVHVLTGGWAHIREYAPFD